MNLKGKFVRREGTQVVFGSRNKPEWKPMDVAGSCDMTMLVPERYYELNVEENRLLAFRELPPPSSGGGGAPGGGGGRPRQDPNVIPRSSLMASATGVYKSMLDKGSEVVDAEKVALRWARMWDPNGTPELPEAVTRPQEAPPAAAQVSSPPLRPAAWLDEGKEY